MQIVFVGERWKDFSLTLPVTGGQLYVTPREKLTVSDEDGQVILGDVNLDFISAEAYDDLMSRPMAAVDSAPGGVVPRLRKKV